MSVSGVGGTNQPQEPNKNQSPEVKQVQQMLKELEQSVENNTQVADKLHKVLDEYKEAIAGAFSPQHANDLIQMVSGIQASMQNAGAIIQQAGAIVH